MGYPAQAVTDLDKSPVVQITTWLALITAFLATVSRVGSKLLLVRTVKLDDYFVVAALFTCISQSAAVLVQCSHGFGKHIKTLDQSDVSIFLKSEYAASLFFIGTMFLTKVSCAETAMTLVHSRYKLFVRGIEIFIFLWAISAVFAVLFQCFIPIPWNYLENKCIHRIAFWTCFSAGNIATDVILVLVIDNSIRQIQTTWTKKALVMLVFGSRILNVPVIILQIYYSRMALNSADPTFDMWQAAVVTQAVQCIGIVTTCLPSLKIFIDKLESGQLRADDLRRRGKDDDSGLYYGGGSRGTYAAHDVRSSRGAANLPTLSSQHSKVHELTNFACPPNRIFIKKAQGPPIAWDGQSHTSQRGLIHQTKTWEVNVEWRNQNTSPE